MAIQMEIPNYELANILLLQKEPFTPCKISEELGKRNIVVETRTVKKILEEFANQWVVIKDGSRYTLNRNYF
ncbi:hypothetical protein [Syntrophomonas curvata]